MHDPTPADVPITAADGTGLAMRRTGRGAPVVLVHGSGGGLDSWDPVVPLLTDEFELWTYARRGYAPSAGCRRPKTFADDVADLAAVLAAAGGPAHVAGVSYGATVVLHTARTHRDLVRSAAVFEPPLYAAGSALGQVLDRYRDLVERGDLSSATRLFAEQVSRVPAALLDGLGQDADVPPDPSATAAAAAEAIGCLHDLEAMASDTPDVSRWSDLQLPVLLLQGADTWAPMPATMAALAEALPGAVRSVLEGQSHFATHTAPDLFARPLRDFLRSQDRH